MTPKPTGRLLLTGEGRDLVITRSFPVPIEDVWASITEPERTARWFGPWTGEAGPGRTISYTMSFEQEGPPSSMLIEACEPPTHLAVRALNDYGDWRLEIHLTEANGVTELRFTQHLDESVNVGDIGPGWEYYLDNLVASREGAVLPNFNDYYPSQKQYFLDQLPA
jgi:uncharacterized protein YndB with AHSA1/START domain